MTLLAAHYAAAMDRNETFHFSLIRSDSPDVCAAYLERLNSVSYDATGSPEFIEQNAARRLSNSSADEKSAPYCDRPETDAIPGFSKLVRVPLSAGRKQALIREVWNVTHPSYYQVGEKPAREMFPDGMANSSTAWGYPAPIDIEHTGVPVWVIVWRGWGAASGTQICTVPYDYNSGFPWRSVQQALILTPSGDHVDVAKTIAVFGRTGAVPDSELKPIGRSISVFEFHGKYYFDAFLLGPMGRLDSSSDLRWEDKLGVFVHEQGKTRQICEYQMRDPELARFKRLVPRP